MVILIAAFALASALDRRTGLVVAILAGIIAAIVPGSTSFTHTHVWDSLFRLCFLLAMSMSFYRVIVALRDREDHLQRQLGDVRCLQEEVTTLHTFTVRPPIDRDVVYQQIARAAFRLARGTASRLMIRIQPDDHWQVVGRWPVLPEGESSGAPTQAVDAADIGAYAIAPDPAGAHTITVPLSTGTHVEGVLQLESAMPKEQLEEYGQLLAVYARDATLTLDHVALLERLEHLAVMGERGRIARDLHDGLVQSLAGVAFHLEYYRDLLTPEAVAMRTGLDRMANDVKEALHEARSMIHELRSAPTPGATRRGAGRSGRIRWPRRAALSITADIPEQVVPVSRAQASALFRIAQEALQNIVKHARADAASVRLVTDGRGAVLEIADNGRGFVPFEEQRADPPAHFGLDRHGGACRHARWGAVGREPRLTGERR